MNWETMEARWSQLETRLERMERVQIEVMRAKVADQAWRKVRWTGAGLIFELATTALFWLVGFVVLLRFPMPVGGLGAHLALLAGGLLWIVDQARLLARFVSLPWAGPIVPIQAALSRWRLERVRQFQWVLLGSPLAWFLFVLVAFAVLTGRDPFQTLPSGWIVANLAFGCLFPLVGGYLARWLSQRHTGSAWWEKVLDAMSGKGVADARAELAQWNQETWEKPS